MERKHIALKEKLAAALYEIIRLRFAADGYPPPWLMREMKWSADDMLALFDWDHNILHANSGEDIWWNLTPMLRADHREKTKTDLGIIAKSKRLQRKQAKHIAAMNHAADVSAVTFAHIQEVGRRIRKDRLARKWPSRPFPKRRKSHDPAS